MIRLEYYDRDYQIVRYYKTREAIEELQEDINTIYISGLQAVLLPENEVFYLTEGEKEEISKYGQGTVFALYDHSAKVMYDPESLDNAIVITNLCNSNCIMCPCSDIQRQEKGISKSDYLIELSRHIPNDASHITITGGEPFLMKRDIFVFLDYLKSHRNQTTYLLLSNGRAFAIEDYAKSFAIHAPSDILLGIPLHGSTAELHDHITRARGSYDQTLMGIKKLLSYGMDVEIRIVVSQLNLNDLDNIARLIVKEIPSVTIVNFIGLEMLGNARVNKDEVWIDTHTSFKAMRSSIDYLIENGIDTGIYNYPLCSVDPEYWHLCSKSISTYKVRFSENCEGCKAKNECGGLFSGSFDMMKGIVKAI